MSLKLGGGAGAAVLLLLSFFFPAGELLAQDHGQKPARGKQPVLVRADQVEYFDSARKVVAVGNVEATYEDSKLTCDEATIYMDTKDAYLRGRVRLVQLSGLLKGEEMVYNFQTKKGTVLEAEGEAGPWRSRGDRADKISPESFLHREGYLTTCEFEQPHSRLQAREVRIFLDDKVVLKNVVFYVGSVPTLYLPSYTHPLDDKRPRVTLIPGKDKEWGPYLLSSWRVYIHENLQGRFLMDYRDRLDLATGFDLKYRIPGGGEGVFREYYTHERALQRKHLWSSLTNPDKGKPTTERERFRVQLHHLWQLDDSTQVRLEYNRMKDPTVIQDFFLRESEQNTFSPDTYLQFLRTGPWYGLNLLIRKRVNRFESVTQELPSAVLNIRPIRLSFLPSFWKEREQVEALPSRPADGNARHDVSDSGWYYQSSYNYSHTDVAAPLLGTENSLLTFNTLQEIFYPMRLFRALNFRPFASFQQSSFSRGLNEQAPQFRQAGAAGFDLSAKFFRVFLIQTDLLGLNIKSLRHVVTPTLGYKYQGKPTISADRLLRSDGLAKSNRVTLGMEHKLQIKQKAAGEGEGVATRQSVDLGRFQVTMPYDLEGASGVGGEWNNLTMDLEVSPIPWGRFEADAGLDPHIGKFQTINFDFITYPGIDFGSSGARGTTIGQNYDKNTGDLKELPWAVGLGWRYQRNTSAQMTLETEFNLTPKWRAGIYQALDVKRFATETGPTESRTVKHIYDIPEYEYRLRRDLHEWTVELIYNVRREQGDAIMVLFRLKEFGQEPLGVERSYNQPKAGRNFAKR